MWHINEESPTDWKKSWSMSASLDHTTLWSLTSSKYTVVPFMKFLPMMNISSPPRALDWFRDFLEISGAPVGWAEEKIKEDS